MIRIRQTAGVYMATNFYFQSIHIQNFRTFKEVKLPKLKRINIVGGFNGVGKTALLEVLFYTLDRRNPVSMLKPLFFRRFATSAPIDPLQFLNDKTVPHASIEWGTFGSSAKLEIDYELKPDDIPVPVESGSLENGLAQQFGTDGVFSTQKGLHIRLLEGGDSAAKERFFCMVAPNGMTGIVQQSGTAPIPNAEYVSTSTRADSKRLAQIISTLIKERRLQEVVNYMKLLHSALETLVPLQDGDETQVYAQSDDGSMLPVQYMGDGFQNLLHTLCAIVRCKNGVVLLDEIDAAIHYSVVTDAWSIISRAASKENCQIFATTHSRECIHSAALGIKNAGCSKDFQYIRLEKRPEQHIAVAYDIDELADAEQYNIEIR